MCPAREAGRREQEEVRDANARCFVLVAAVGIRDRRVLGSRGRPANGVEDQVRG